MKVIAHLITVFIAFGSLSSSTTIPQEPSSKSKVLDATKSPSAAELLKASDRARGAAEEGLTWDISISTLEDGNSKTVDYLVKAKGDNALATATQPARNRGETMIFNDRNLWFFKPGLKKPMAISPRQKLMGEAANGDIASTQYYRDYDGEIIGEEEVDGQPAFKLMLKAKAKNVTYDGIRYWISKKDQLGVKAEFLTVGGEVFKTASFKYGNAMTVKGETYPFVSEMSVNDVVKPANVTTITYSKPRLEAHSDSIFNVNNLMR